MYTSTEVNQVNELEFSGKLNDKRAQTRLNSLLDPAVDRFNNDLTEEQQDTFKSSVTKFVRTYQFVLQIGPFTDIELHKLYVHLSYLLRKLPKEVSERLQLADDIALEYYRNTKVFEGHIGLEEKGQVDLNPQQHAGGTAPDEETERLSIILNQFNERFGTEFSQVDKIMEEMEEGLSENENVRESGKNNTFDNFKYGFNEEFMDLFVRNIEKGDDYMGILENPEALGMLQEYLALKIYNSIQERM